MQALDLTVRRGSEVLFKALRFAWQPGQMVWLRGANGSGKTSLLRVLAGLARPDSGVLHWHTPAESAAGPTTQMQPASGTTEVPTPRRVYLAHANALKDDLSALEALQFLAQLHGLQSTLTQLESALRHMGVFHRRKLAVRMLSQGQRRRVALARLALEAQPGFWILDEPFDALDDAGVALVLSLMQGNLQRGGGVLFTSHIAVHPEGLPLVELTLQGARA